MILLKLYFFLPTLILYFLVAIYQAVQSSGNVLGRLVQLALALQLAEVLHHLVRALVGSQGEHVLFLPLVVVHAEP